MPSSCAEIKMGLSDDEIQQIVSDWRDASPNIVKLWWDVDRAVKKCIKNKGAEEDVNGLHIFCESGFLFIELPSGRRLVYVKPKSVRTSSAANRLPTWVSVSRRSGDA